MPGLGALFGGVAIVFMLVFAGGGLLPVALAYVALRVQDARQEEPDTKLGLKTAFHTVHTIAILMILFGLTIFMGDVMSGTIAPAKGNPNQNFGPPPQQGPGLSDTKRIALALVVSGALFSLGFWSFLLRTNDNSRRAVRRVFVGGRMALCLLILMLTVTGLFMNLVQRNPNAEMTEWLLATLIVWAPAAIIHMLLFFAASAKMPTRVSRGDDEEERGWHPSRA